MKVRVMFKTVEGYTYHWLTKAEGGFITLDCHSNTNIYDGFTIEEVDHIREEFNNTLDAYFLFSI